jgi:cyclohexanone monooxygenase
LKPGWSRERRENFTTVSSGLPFEVDLVSDGWTLITRRLWANPNKSSWTPEQLAQQREIEDYRLMSDIRARVDSIITRKDVAERLKAWYRWNCKRPTFNDDYLPTFNRENVTLVDVSAARGVERISENGVVANGVEYAVDCIIYASGFEVTSSIRRRLGIPVIEGRGGLSLYDHWDEGFKTLHGFMTSGFPNQFFTGFVQGGVSANLTTMLDEQTNHIAYIIKQTMARGAETVEATEAAQAAWQDTLRETSIAMRAFLKECTPGSYNNEGGATIRSYIGDVYGKGFNAFTALLADWRSAGTLDGLVLL